jgi:hypothetical protein
MDWGDLTMAQRLACMQTLLAVMLPVGRGYAEGAARAACDAAGLDYEEVRDGALMMTALLGVEVPT